MTIYKTIVEPIWRAVQNAANEEYETGIESVGVKPHK